MNKLQALFIVLLCSACFTYAQKPSRIGYVDMDYILSHLEDYKVASQQFALQVEQWEAEIAKRQEKIKAEKDKLEAEKALLTPELIKDKEEEIALLEYNLNAYKQQKFDAKEGEYITQKFMLAKPIQDQVFNIVQEIGKMRKYDFIFEKSDATMLFSNEQHNLSKVVLRALKKKDNAEDRNKDMAQLLKESYDFEFVEERVKKRKEAEKAREQRRVQYEQERLRKTEEMKQQREQLKAKREKEQAERQQKFQQERDALKAQREKEQAERQQKFQQQRDSIKAQRDKEQAERQQKLQEQKEQREKEIAERQKKLEEQRVQREKEQAERLKKQQEARTQTPTTNQ
ncbi:OmpH family outer membrane protein [Capnocytophaga ochracea]|jgi:outer membrane chaperone skp (ompH)|uniref:OmpH family outer membrane protein n=1 Tax=Capnocytophaga ochracea TaxID=1018 RepID=UPI002B477A94|nr:OmpH family outer membrane protein [Capnocytophaga ochracea]MEB3037019.1 OmpH family outer membrane protein [Capnocytophaga ochracea]